MKLQHFYVYPKKSFLGLLIFCFCALFTSQASYANHFAGMDISYECLGNNEYRVKLGLYRDCSGVGMSTLESVRISSQSCGVGTIDLLLPLDTFYEVSQLCSADLASSACASPTGIFPGYEVYYYTGVVTLPQSCPDWIVAWSSCCRNGPITTVVTTGSMYGEAMINSTVCNSSPEFHSRPLFYFCAGHCYQYGHGASDVENDTLRYVLECPLETVNSCVSYNAGLSPTQPFFTTPANSFSINDRTGEMNFCPAVGQAQYAMVKVRVYQIANNDTLGYIERDIDMIVLNNSANCSMPVHISAPTLLSSGFYDSLTHDFYSCQDDLLTFSLVVNDLDTNTVFFDSLFSNLDASIGAGNWSYTLQNTAPYRADSALFVFQIQTNRNHVGSTLMQFTFTDNGCPMPGRNSVSYNLQVVGMNASASKVDLCPGISDQIQLDLDVFAASVGSLSWTQVSGPLGTFDNDTIANPIFTVPSTTQDGDSIVLVVAMGTNTNPITGISCAVSDTIVVHFNTIPLDVTILASDDFFCLNTVADTIDLSISVAQPNVNVQNGVYLWSANPAAYLSNLSSISNANPTAIINGNTGDSVHYSVSYNYGLCSGTDDIELVWVGTTLNLGANIDTICPNDTVQLEGLMSDTNYVLNPNFCENYVVNAIPFAPVAGSGLAVTLSDDANSTILPIGFNFNFYCNDYAYFRINSNGFITFDMNSTASGCCTGQLLPDSLSPNNLIALAWEDWSPQLGGVIEYFTVGLAPNRQLVVNYTGVPRYGMSDSLVGQIVLYEGTNDIDLYMNHIGQEGNTTQGIENADGTMGITVPGRNSSIWSAANEGYRFSIVPNYIVGPVDYDWTPSTSLTNDAISNPLAFPDTTTTYQLTLSNHGCVLKDSIQIVVESSMTPPVISCGTTGNPQSEISFHWGGSLGASGWEYSLDLGNNWVAAPLQDSNLFFANLGLGTCMDLWVRAVDSSANCYYSGVSHLQCCVDSNYIPCLGYNATISHSVTNGIATFSTNVIGGTAPFAYSWNFGDGTNGVGANPNHSYSNSGTYPVSLIVSDSNNCIIFAFDTVVVHLPTGPCLDNKVILDLRFDNYPDEISWNIQDSLGAVVASGSGYTSALSNGMLSDTICLLSGCYTFHIFDAYGDGMCCLYGLGSYSLMDSAGTILADGAAFAASESTLFCVGGSTHPCLNLAGSYTHVITGNVASFTGTSTGVNTQYSWDFGDNNTAVGANPVHSYLNIPTSGYYIACVDMQDSFGCSNSFCDTIYLSPMACNDHSVTLSLQLDNFANESSWTITDSSGTIVESKFYTTSDDGNLVIKNLCLPAGCYDFNIYDAYADGICCNWGLGYYLLTDTFGNALASGGTFAASESTNFCVGAATNPCAALNVSFSHAVGANGLVNFVPQVSGGTGPLSYFWDFGIDSSMTTGASYSFTFNGTYLICLTVSDAAGCLVTYCDTIMVTTAIQNPSTGACLGVTGNMNISQDTTNAFVLWLQPLINNAPLNAQFEFYWNFGDGSGIQVGAPSHQYTSFGAFTICMLAIDTVNQCQVLFCDTISFDSVGNFSRNLNYKDVKPGFVINPMPPIINYNTSVNQLVSDEKIVLALFPNPTDGAINLSVKSELSMDSEVMVLDITGKEIYKTQHNFQAGEDRMILPTDQLPSGVYIVRMKSNTFEQSLKFIKKGL